MSASNFFENVTQTEIVSGNYKFKTPFFIQDADVMGAFFLCDYKQARDMLAPGFVPLKFPLNKALFAINCIEYKNTDIGPYNEIALSIIIRPPGLGILQSLKFAHSIMRAHFHAYILHLPVTTEMSVAGGKDVLSYPKFLADISFRDTGTHRICTLRDKQTLEMILELECPNIKARQGLLNLMRQHMCVNTYVEKFKKSNAIFKMNIFSAGQSFVWPRVGLRLGKHDVAEQLRKLKIGQQIYQVSIPKVEGMLIKNEQ